MRTTETNAAAGRRSGSATRARRLRLRPDGNEVECVFFLENDGPATTVTMGFPNESAGTDVEEPVPFTSFASYVDGDTAGVTIRPEASRGYLFPHRSWYTKTVSFAAGQRRCVRDVYTGTRGSTGLDVARFQYILWSGATWKGPIGVADVVVTFDSLAAPPASLEAEPADYRRSGNELRWHFTDIEPRAWGGPERISLTWRTGR